MTEDADNIESGEVGHVPGERNEKDTIADPPHCESGSKIVDVVGRMRLTGNLIPAAWYETILCGDGEAGRKRKVKPDRLTIDVLSEILYWYRPALDRDGKRGRFKKRFKADLLQLDRGTLAEKFKVSTRQISRSCEKLEQLGVIMRHFRTITKGGGGAKLRNVMYIELIPAGLAKVSRVELPSESARVDAGVNTSGHARHHVRTPASGRIDTRVRTNTKIATESTTISSFSGAKRPHPGDKMSNKNNSGSAASGAAAPDPAAVAENVPSEQTGAAAPGTPARDATAASIQGQDQDKDQSSSGMDGNDDPEVEKAKRKTDKLLRYASQAHAYLLDKGIVESPLRDRLERARAPITKFLLEFPEYKVARLLETLILVWTTEVSPDHQWYAWKLNAAPGLLPKVLGKGENRKDHSVVEGAALEFGINLAQPSDAETRKVFGDAGILESWVAEYKGKGAGRAGP